MSDDLRFHFFASVLDVKESSATAKTAIKDLQELTQRIRTAIDLECAHKGEKISEDLIRIFHQAGRGYHKKSPEYLQELVALGASALEEMDKESSVGFYRFLNARKITAAARGPRSQSN